MLKNLRKLTFRKLNAKLHWTKSSWSFFGEQNTGTFPSYLATEKTNNWNGYFSTSNRRKFKGLTGRVTHQHDILLYDCSRCWIPKKILRRNVTAKIEAINGQLRNMWPIYNNSNFLGIRSVTETWPQTHRKNPSTAVIEKCEKICFVYWSNE